MQFVQVEELPERTMKNGRKGATKHRLELFMEMKVKIAKVVLDDDDYVCPVSAYCSLAEACENLAFPIDVKMRNGEIYLIRRDM
jgi:hypothetical protein